MLAEGTWVPPVALPAPDLPLTLPPAVAPGAAAPGRPVSAERACGGGHGCQRHRAAGGAEPCKGCGRGDCDLRRRRRGCLCQQGIRVDVGRLDVHPRAQFAQTFLVALRLEEIHLRLEHDARAAEQRGALGLVELEQLAHVVHHVATPVTADHFAEKNQLYLGVHESGAARVLPCNSAIVGRDGSIHGLVALLSQPLKA